MTTLSRPAPVAIAPGRRPPVPARPRWWGDAVGLIVWATADVARGASAVDRVAGLHGTSGLLVLADGTVHRWANQP